MGHVRAFSGAPYSSAQRQNIFVRVFRWTWISRPTTGSHSGICEQLLRLAQRELDVAAHLDHRDPISERSVHAPETDPAFARFERQLPVDDLLGAPSFEHARARA